MKIFDLLILGGGSAAFAAADEALHLGACVAMVEQGPIGGTCLNRGCVPSKFLLHAAALSGSHRRRWAAAVSEKNKIIDDGRKAKADFVRRHRKRLIYIVGHGVFQSSHTLSVNDEVLRFARGLIAAGGHPTIPAIQGLELVPYLTSNTIFELPKLPRTMVVIGTGPLGLELGQMLSHFGVRVTLISKDPRLLASEEPEVGHAIQDVLQDERLNLLFRCMVKKVDADKNHVVLSLRDVKGKQFVIRAERLLVASGWTASTSGMGIEATGVRLNAEGQVVVGRHLQTNISHFWAAGDCISCHCPNRNVYAAKRQGAEAAANALRPSIRRTIDYSAMPRVVFTTPEVACVGLTESQARAKGLRIISRSIPLKDVPRAWLQGKTKGVVKMVAERSTQRLLGVSLVSPRAGEVIHEAALALQKRQTAGPAAESFSRLSNLLRSAPNVCAAFPQPVSCNVVLVLAVK